MKVTRLPDVEPGSGPRSVAIGTFDGVHLGHREVIRGSDTVLTFDPHPLSVIHPEATPKLLNAFASAGAHANDIAAILDAKGICVRAGAHCTQPLHQMLGFSSTCRASFAMYSTLDEVDALADAVEEALAILK